MVKIIKGWSTKELRVSQKSFLKRLGQGILVILFSACCLTTLVLAETSSDYEALRLLTEALNEISTKAVFQKNNQDLFQGALRGMMNSLDPDCSYLSPEDYAKYQRGQKEAPAEAGVDLVFKDHLLTAVSVLDGGPADRAGLKSGDHILKINGHLIRNITTQEGARDFKGPAGKTVKLEVMRNGLVKPLNLSVTLEPLGPAMPKVKMLKDGYAYLRIPYFTDNIPKVVAQELNNLTKATPPIKGLILDLRNNARGTLEQAVRTASLFLGNQKVVSTKGQKSSSEQSYQGSDREQVLKSPLPTVVLVDQGTARAAEILAGALQYYHRGLLLGDKTYGLCGLTRVVPLQDGSALLMTVAYCYTPGGQKISGDGLKPDIEAQKPPEEDTAALTKPIPQPEADPWVQQAVEALKSGKVTAS
jgi:carboxyl-terminal processing protease